MGKTRRFESRDDFNKHSRNKQRNTKKGVSKRVINRFEDDDSFVDEISATDLVHLRLNDEDI